MDKQTPYKEIVCKILRDAERSARPIAFIPNQGNAGDCLINSATYQVLDRLNLRYEEIDPRYIDPKYFSGKTVLIGGGGGFTKNYMHTKKIIECMIPYANQIIVLPQSINAHLEFITSLPGSVTLICREQTSFDYLKSTGTNAEIHLGCDMALQLNPSDLRQPELLSLPVKKILKFALAAIRTKAIRLSTGNTLYAMRNDCEKTKTPTSMKNLDLSEMLALGTFNRRLNDFVSYHFLKQIDQFNAVHTNRLHVSIGAILLNKDTFIYDNNYGKNRSVYLHSLSSKANVHWID